MNFYHVHEEDTKARRAAAPAPGVANPSATFTAHPLRLTVAGSVAPEMEEQVDEVEDSDDADILLRSETRDSDEGAE